MQRHLPDSRGGLNRSVAESRSIPGVRDRVAGTGPAAGLRQ